MGLDKEDKQMNEMMTRQIEELKKHGVRVLEVKPRMKMVVVSKSDLDRATEMKISNEITIACRYW